MKTLMHECDLAWEDIKRIEWGQMLLQIGKVVGVVLLIAVGAIVASLIAYRKEGGGANGASRVCCYKPEYPGQPLIVKWSYYGGLYGETDRNVWHYEATLNPSFPMNDMSQRLTVRFYPGGRVAARYTEKPESSDFSNASPELSGAGWVQAQGTPLPPLLAKEQEVRTAGQGAELEVRPAPATPAVGDAVVKTNSQRLTQ